MAITSYRPVIWNNEPVSKEKLNTMANNIQYVYENMPRMMYSANGIKKTNSIKVLAGVLIVAPTGVLYGSGRVEFGTYFTAGCRPVVVTGTQPTGSKWNWNVVIKGIGAYHPDHRGVEFHVRSVYDKNNIMDQRVHVHYVVIGW